jgi:hypothetical protein
MKLSGTSCAPAAPANRYARVGPGSSFPMQVLLMSVSQRLDNVHLLVWATWPLTCRNSVIDHQAGRPLSVMCVSVRTRDRAAAATDRHGRRPFQPTASRPGRARRLCRVLAGACACRLRPALTTRPSWCPALSEEDRRCPGEGRRQAVASAAMGEAGHTPAAWVTPIRWPSGSVNWPMTGPPGTWSGPIRRVQPRLSACASAASTLGTST